MMYLESVKQSIIENGLINPGEHIGAAVSGGADSVFLLHTLLALRSTLDFRLTVLHLEHGIRGNASKRDLDFVLKMCQTLKVSAVVECVDTRGYARKKGYSLEQAARELRFAFFENSAEQYGIDKIALAHHQGDQAETILLNMVRGSGMQGLLGMQAFRAPRYIRPMLGIQKDAILTALKQAKVPFRKDATNRNIYYSRNRIRHAVIPELKTINPRAEQNILRTAASLAAEDDYMEAVATQEKKTRVKVKNGEIKLALDGWDAVHTALKRRVIRQVFSEYFSLRDVEFIHIESIIGISLSQNGKSTYVPGGVTAAKAYRSLVFFKSAPIDGTPVALEIGQDREFDYAGYRFTLSWPDKVEFGSGTECLDTASLEGAVFRTPQPNDTIQPLGMTGKKNVSDYLCDKKVPLHQRETLPVLAVGDKVLMVTGVGIAETAKVSESTKSVCRIEFRKL